MGMRITVDRDQCQGNGVCAMIAPEVFAVDADALAYVRVDAVPAEAEGAVIEAVDLCPRSALLLEQP